MKEVYFIVEALSELILPISSTSTGNVMSWDFIPGSRFWGIAAKNLYEQLSPTQRLQVFHSGNYSFGDALPVVHDQHRSYHLPLALFGEKGTSILDDANYVYHKLTHDHATPNAQLVQRRGGFITTDKFYIQVKKRFALKSAFDRQTRRAKDEAMFGFESLLPGQKFIFSLRVEDDDEALLHQVVRSLEGIHSVGKAKTAQYGKVLIQKITLPSVVATTQEDDLLYIYIDTPLALLGNYGHPSFQITPALFQLPDGCTIDWHKSQIRTHSYSTWNIKRSTLNTERHVIVPGSVIVISVSKEISPDTLPTQVGAFKAEGHGRLIYNPQFLQATDSAKWSWRVQAPSQPSTTPDQHLLDMSVQHSDPLIAHLNKVRDTKMKEYHLYSQVHEAIENFSSSGLKNISPSQWGALRDRALQWKLTPYREDKNFIDYIIDDYLAKGTRSKTHWKPKIRTRLKQKLQDIKDEQLQADFLILLAQEMAKVSQSNAENNADIPT